jgi:hypothetical protein
MLLPGQLPAALAPAGPAPTLPAPAGPAAGPASAADAAAMVQAGLGWLAGADAASLGTAEQAQCLRALERAESVRVAARSGLLSAFAACGGFEEDGQGSARSWLRWQTQVTAGAAAAAMGWARRLEAHRAVGAALACGQVSVSFARQICLWSEELPAAHRADADVILLAAAAGGAELADLAALAQEMRRRAAGPDGDGAGDGFAGRWARLETTFGGAGRLEGDLTPECAAALSAVLESLAGKAGPEDVRTRRQRDHDALEEACRRLIGAGCLPGRAGQPTQIQLHMSLDELRGLDGAGAGEDAWASERASMTGWLSGPGAAGAACDAAIVPVVSGHVDPGVLDRLAAGLLHGEPPGPGPGQNGEAVRPGQALGPGKDGQDGQTGGAARARGAGQSGPPCSAARRRRSDRAARKLILRAAADLLSGPAGLAAYLRTGLPDGLAASVSLPLDIGAATDTIPVHLRRAVTARDRHCRFPGCRQPPAACQPHHIIPRAQGGPTSLTNMLNLCAFHHLIAVHRWGITLHPDGTTTATSPDGTRTLHSHGPPADAA